MVLPARTLLFSKLKGCVDSLHHGLHEASLTYHCSHYHLDADLHALSCSTEMGSGLSAGDWWDQGNFPHLSNGKVVRFEWFIMILQLVTLGVLTLAIISRCVHQSRLTLISFLAVTTALVIIAADQFNNIRGSRQGRQYKSSTDVFAGFVLCAIGNLGLLYLLGIEPYAAQGEPVSK